MGKIKFIIRLLILAVLLNGCSYLSYSHKHQKKYIPPVYFYEFPNEAYLDQSLFGAWYNETESRIFYQYNGEKSLDSEGLKMKSSVRLVKNNYTGSESKRHGSGTGTKDRDLTLSGTK